MTSTEQTNGSNGSTGERAGRRRRNIILGAVAVGVLALALLAVGVLPRNSGTSGCQGCPVTTTTRPDGSDNGKKPTTTVAPTTETSPTVSTTTIVTTTTTL